MSINATDIYYRMLEIGSENLEEGISLGNIINILKQENLLSDYKNTEHIEEWIQWSFEHKETGCYCPVKETGKCGCKSDDPCNEFDHHNICKRFLTKEALLDFSQLEQSRKLTKQINIYEKQLNLLQSQLKLTEKSSEAAKTQSNKSLKYAIYALIISAFMGIPNFIGLCTNPTKTSSKNNTTKVLNILKEEKSILLQSNQYLDSLNLTLNDLLQRDKQDSTHRE